MVQSRTGKKVKTWIIWAALSLSVLLNGGAMAMGFMPAASHHVTVVADGGGRPPGGG